jgi:hypothetical protein
MKKLNMFAWLILLVVDNIVVESLEAILCNSSIDLSRLPKYSITPEEFIIDIDCVFNGRNSISAWKKETRLLPTLHFALLNISQE